MLILSKKRICLILLFIGISIFTFLFGKMPEQEKTIQTVSLPVSGKTIVIDAGHGKPDVGVSLLHKVKNKSNYSVIKN